MFRADVERCLSVNGRAVRRGRIVTLYKIGSMAATRENVPCGIFSSGGRVDAESPRIHMEEQKFGNDVCLLLDAVEVLQAPQFSPCRPA